ncbi:Imm1 family immunity protein [Micromonospora globbae]|uniref:Imm1 family immunity protein n=1 Tax=Micromonospora globbae TaxID=1894969 RepID=UPI0037B94227
MQVWIDGTATTVTDVAELDTILGDEPPGEVTLASDAAWRTLHISFWRDRAGLYWESETDILLAWGPVPPGAPGNQVVGDAEYAYDDPRFALPDGIEPFEVTHAEARQAAHEFLRTDGRPTNVQWVVKP